MLSLTKIFLHNWHRFHHHLIDVKDSLYLAGHNGSGKSSILDAIQLVLIADMVRVRFNSSAQERSQRNLDSYVRGKIGEKRYLRPGNAIAYVALEFTAQEGGQQVTIGICVEASAGKSTNRLYFILAEGLEPDFFVPAGQPLARRDLKKLLRQRQGGQAFDKVTEYRTEMLAILGGLSPRFFDLFMRALTFQPIRDIREFVEQWLLPESPLDIQTLQQVVENLSILRERSKEVEERQIMLRAIVQQQEESRRQLHLHAQYKLLAVFLRLHLATKKVTELEKQVEEEQSKIAQGSKEIAIVQAALEEAQNLLLEAKVQWRQMDVARREKELDAAMARATQELNDIRQRWRLLQQDLLQESVTLRHLFNQVPLELTEWEAINTLAEALSSLKPHQLPDDLDALGDLLEYTIPFVDGAKVRAQEEQFRLMQKVEGLRKKGAKLSQDLTELRSQHTPRYPRDVERLRELLTPIIGQQPPLLCQLLTVPEQRWQDAVEALLGNRRFNIIVPPEAFEVALQVLDEARAREKLYGVGLVDLDRVKQDNRRATRGSLALKVETDDFLVRPYLDTVLGDIICCETAYELRRHRRAVTPDVIVYSEWTARALPPRHYRPWMIGDRARLSQISEHEEELASLGDRFTALAPKIEEVTQHVQLLDRGRTLSNLLQRLDADFEEEEIYKRMEAYEEELQKLDFLSAKEIEDEVKRLQQIVDREDKERLQLTKQLATWTQKALTLEEELKRALRLRQEQEQQATELRLRYPDAIEEAEKLLEIELSGEVEQEQKRDLREVALQAENHARTYENKARAEQRQLTEEATIYNTRYQFGAQASNPHETRYATELERLEATELPRFRARIEQAQRQAEEEIREHVLHKLREQILNARQELDHLNDSLTRLEFHGERYRFCYYPAEDVQAFYDLIMNTHILGADSLFSSQFYNEHQVSFNQFYEQLTHPAETDAEQRQQQRLSDYRRYLTYDIEVTHPDGRSSRLSRIMGQTSGGETQTPFYLTIAASFVQLYNINMPPHRPTIRLIAFDETFSKMDQDRIGSTLDLFQKFQLQIITATPLERCEYLVPKICTNLVLTGIGDRVLIEPYRNYKAQLNLVYQYNDIPEQLVTSNGHEQ